MPVVDAFFDWPAKIYNIYNDLLVWFSSTVISINGNDVTVNELVIGGALVAVLGYLFIKFVVPN